MGEFRPTMQQEDRPSLLDVVLGQRGNSTTVLNRLIYVAHVSAECNEITAIEGYHKTLFMQNGTADLNYTGCLMHFGNDTILHMIEGTSGFIEGFLSALFDDKSSPVKDVKIVLSTEDIPHPAMPMWFTKSINLPRPDSDLDKKEPMAPHLYRTYTGLLEIGAILSKQDSGEQTETIENLKAQYHEQLPGNELIESFIRSNGTTSLSSFLGIYTEEVQILEESERIWPMLPGLQY